MVEFFVVVGEANVGKTASIAALTGTGRVRRQWNVDFGPAGIHQTYVQLSALQESRISAADFIQRVQASGSSRVIVALRNSTYRGFPDAQTYLNAFVAAQVVILGLVRLGAPQKAWFNSPIQPANAGTPFQQLPQRVAGSAANTMAAQLRVAWGII